MSKRKDKVTRQIEEVPTSDLIPYARNAKIHNDEQVAQIAGSIREFGFNNPVLIDSGNGIIAGHGRVLAASKLKMETVPCLRLSHLSETQKRAYILADNRLAETGGGWNEELLKLELTELQELDFDISLSGFDGEFGEISRESPDCAGASPWDRVGDAQEGVMFSFGEIQARLPAELAIKFASSAPQEKVKEWLEGKINACCDN